MIVRLVVGDGADCHFKDWWIPAHVSADLPRMVVLQSDRVIPNLKREIIDWINENIQHPFYIMGVGDHTPLVESDEDDPYFDDHIRFTNISDFTLFKLRWQDGR